MTNTTNAQSAISVLTALAAAPRVSLATISADRHVTLNLLVDFGLAVEVEPLGRVRLFSITDAGRSALVKVHDAQRVAMNEVLFNACSR